MCEKADVRQLLIVWLGILPLPAAGQQPQTPAPAGQGRGWRGGLFPETEPDDVAGFVPIFDGKTLDGWDGDQTFWRAENGSIVGETTPEKVVKLNNFLIWRGGTVKDFELKVEFRLSGTNSGIQYRSVELPAIGKWVLKGYQADLDFTEGFVGNIHDERGRSPSRRGHVILSPRGQATRIVDGPKYKVLGKIGDPTLLRGVMNVNGWNRYHIIARGPVILQFLNSQLMSVAIDEDTAARRSRGRAGLPDAHRAAVQDRVPERDVSEAAVGQVACQCGRGDERPRGPRERSAPPKRRAREPCRRVRGAKPLGSDSETQPERHAERPRRREREAVQRRAQVGVVVPVHPLHGRRRERIERRERRRADRRQHAAADARERDAAAVVEDVGAAGAQILDVEDVQHLHLDERVERSAARHAIACSWPPCRCGATLRS